MCNGHPELAEKGYCCCKVDDPCDYHAATCIVCTPKENLKQ